MLNSRFIKVDTRLMSCKELKWNEKMILALILNNRDRCFVKNSYFSSKLGISEREVQRALKYLKDNSYIELYYTNRSKREIVVLYKTDKLFY